jgi:hypothetical protein
MIMIAKPRRGSATGGKTSKKGLNLAGSLPVMGKKKYIKILVEYPKKTHGCYLGVDGRTFLNKLYCMVLTELSWLRRGTVVGHNDVCHELPGCIKGGTFIDHLTDVWFLNSKSAHCLA